MTTATVTVVKENGVSRASLMAYQLEDLLEKVIEFSHQGYDILKGSTVGFTQFKSVVMVRALDVDVDIEPELITQIADSVVKEEQLELSIPEPEATTEESFIDEDYLISIDGDKDKLEAYGKELGIDLKKSKSFQNMVKDLREYIESL